MTSRSPELQACETAGTRSWTYYGVFHPFFWATLGGVATDPQKTEAVQDWPVPTTVREVRSFLGFVGYYRRFVPAFVRRAGPLHALLRGTGGNKTKLVDWTPECGKAFQDLKEALLRAPVLAYADFGLLFRVYTDASLHGLGAVLA